MRLRSFRWGSILSEPVELTRRCKPLSGVPPGVTLLAVSMTAAVLWGLGPVVSKRGFTYGGDPILAALVVVVTGNVLFWTALAVMYGVGDIFVGIPGWGFAVFLASGLVGTAVGRITTYTGIDRIGASINQAVTSTSPLFASFMAFVFLGERLTLGQAVGVAIVVVGVIVLSLSKGGDITGWRLRDLVFPLAASTAFAVGFILRRFGLTATPATPLEATAINEAAALIGLLAFVLARQSGGVLVAPRRSFAYFAVTGVLSSLGLLLFFIGLDLGRVAIVSSLVGTSPLFAALFSALLLRDVERVTRGVAAGAVLVAVGVVLLTLA